MKFPVDDVRFLREMARDVIEASRVRPGERIGQSPANTLGHTVIRPGGRDCYPAVWVRDFAMSLDCGLIPGDQIEQHFRLFVAKQNGAVERRLKTGAIIPPFAVPDHVNFDGGAVFYPGTMSAGEDQGGEPFGVLPPIDNNFFLIEIARHLGHAPDETLIRTFNAIPADAAKGGMVTTTAQRRAVGFGFCDIVYLTGALLFPSLLRYRAAVQLGLRDAAQSIASHLVPIFGDEKQKSGWLYAATEVGRQPDVWGTLFALHLNVLPADFATKARETVAAALRDGTIVHEGGVRHLPTDAGGWQKVAWDWKVNTYQNGAYWHTPTGWLISALHRSHPEPAMEVFRQYIAHLRGQDFRRGEALGAPWECFGREGQARQNPVYLTSVTLPLSVIQQLEG